MAAGARSAATSSTLALALLLTLCACVDRGAVQAAPRPHPRPRQTLDETLESLLAVPLEIRCERAVLAVSTALRDQVQVFGEQLQEQAGGGLTSSGPARLVFGRLTLSCERLALGVHPDPPGLFRLLCVGGVHVQRVETEFDADQLIIEDGKMHYAGAPRVRIEWAQPLPAPR